MAELRVLETRPDAARRGVVELLEETLARAVAGEIQSVAIAFVEPSGTVKRSWSDTDNIGSLFGVVGWLHHSLLQAYAE